MKGSDIYTFMDGLEMCEQFKGGRFTFAVTRNKIALKEEIKAMDAIKEPDKEFKAVQDELEELYRKHAEKDEHGNPKTRPVRVSKTKKLHQYIIPGMGDPDSDYEKELAGLMGKHAQAFESQKKRDKEFTDFLEEDIKFKPVMVHVDNVPEDLPQFIMEQIHWMVYDDNN